MIAIILAAGRGTRLGELGEVLPKCLLPIGGSTSLELYQRAFERAGVVAGVIVVGGYQVDEVRRRLPAGFRLIENAQYATTNSLTSLQLALEQVDDDIVVVNADVVYHPDLLGRFLRHHRRTAVLVDEMREFEAREDHVRVVDGKIRELSRTVSATESFGEVAQTFRVAREHLPLVKTFVSEQLDAGGGQLYGGAVLMPLIDAGHVHAVYTHQQAWGEFDTADDYRRCVAMAEAHHLTPDYGSYGMADVAPPAPESARSLSAMAAAAWNCFRHHQLPWRLRWLGPLPRAFCRSPRRTFRRLKPLARGTLTVEGFLLDEYGPAMLADLMEHAADLGIRPFLLWGTLLGCVREGHFIRNDHDIDLGLMAEEFGQLAELKRRMVACGYRVRRETPNKLSLTHPCVPLSLDIDVLTTARGHCWNCDPPEDAELANAYWFPRDSLAELSVRILEGVEVYVPVGAEEILTTIYGTWQVPQAKRDYARGPLNLMLWSTTAAAVLHRGAGGFVTGKP
jgi:choline kinase